MAEGTERREVHTDYTATDAGLGATLAKIGGQLQHATHRFEGLQEKFGEFRREQGFTAAGFFGIGLSLGSLIDKAKEATGEFGRTKQSVAGMLADRLGFARGTSEIDRYQRSLVVANKTTEELSDIGTRFVRPLEEVGGIYRTIAGAAGNLGLTQRQVVETTTDATAAAKRWAISGEQAASTVARALTTRTIRGVDDFSLSLRGAVGNLKGLSQSAVFDRVSRALSGSRQIADAMSTGIGASLARIKGNVEDTVRDVAGPVFAKVATKIESWAKHIREAREQGKPLIEAFSQKLVGAFEKLETITRFLVDNWKTIALTIGGIKAAGLAGQLGAQAANLAGSSSLLGQTLGQAGGRAAGALRFASASIAILGTATIVGTAIGEAIGDLINSNAEKQGVRQKTTDALDILLRSAKGIGETPFGQISGTQMKIAENSVRRLEKLGAISDGKLSRSGLAGMLENMDADALGARFGVKKRADYDVDHASRDKFLNQIADAINQVAAPIITQFGTRKAAAGSDEDLKFAKRVNNFYGGIHNTFKIDETVDPDRIFVRALDEIESFADTRTQGDLADPHGD